MEISIEDMQKKFDSLPEDLKWAIMQSGVDEHVVEISKRHGLNIEQMGQLALETQAVMLGFMHPDKFESSISASLNLGEEKTLQIVKEVNEKIFEKMRDMVLALHNVPKGQNDIEKTKRELATKEAEKLEVDKKADEADLLKKREEMVAQDHLKEAGIEVKPNETKGKPLSISMQKLTTFAKSEPVKISEHSTPALTKEETRSDEKKPDTETQTPNYQKGEDPYRMPIE